MKKLHLLSLGALATLLMAADCSNKDSEFYNDVFLSSPDLVNIEQLPSYRVGDVVYVDTDGFGRAITEEGQAQPLDVYQTTGGARSFVFSYLIEKRNATGAWETVQTQDNEVTTDRGQSVNFGDFVQAQAIFDIELQTYEYRGGIMLTAPGDYRLRFTYNSNASKTVILVSESFNNNLFANIYSICSDLDNAGYYYFSVN